MEKNLTEQLIINSKTNSEQLSETSDISLRYSAIEYRGEQIEFILSPDGRQVFAHWRDKKIDLGLDNIYYKEDMCKYVDRELDLISTFPKLPELQGAQLEWFNNNGYRDIRLKYKGRLIKVYLVMSQDIDVTLLISESVRLLQHSGLLEE
jgi:hypothetical protein